MEKLLGSFDDLQTPPSLAEDLQNPSLEAEVLGTLLEVVEVGLSLVAEVVGVGSSLEAEVVGVGLSLEAEVVGIGLSLEAETGDRLLQTQHHLVLHYPEYSR